jgi:N-formylglutamate amidohydrolase
MKTRLPILVTMPHASSILPPEIRNTQLRSGESPEALDLRLLAQGDPFTGELYAGFGVAEFPAPYSRFAVDLNRGRQERGPDGVIRPWDFDQRSFYAHGEEPDEKESLRRLTAYWDPYHNAIATRLKESDIRLLWDGHSLSGTGPALGPDQGRPRPLLCLGNHGDSQGQPLPDRPPSYSPLKLRQLRDAALPLLQKAFPQWPTEGLCKLNDPFESGFVNFHYSHPETPHRVPALLCEINRDSYWNEVESCPLPGAIEQWRKVLPELMAWAVEMAEF